MVKNRETFLIISLASLPALLFGCASDSADGAQPLQTGTAAAQATTSSSSLATAAASSSGGAPTATSLPTLASATPTLGSSAAASSPSASVTATGAATQSAQMPTTTAPSASSSDATGGGGNANLPTGGSGGVAGAGGASGSGGSDPNAGGGGAAGSGGAGGGGGDQSAGCGQQRTLMNGRKTISSGGTNRDYILRVPDDYDNSKPYRLVMAYHWRSGNAEQVANGGMGGSTEDPFYGLWDRAENSTIFVAPEGLDAGWANTGDRDIALTDAILEEIQNDLCIDTTRIFATGFSYGGGMSYALACARPEVFRGVALYAGAQLSGCSGGETPVAYFHAHGVSDSVLDVTLGRQIRDRFVEVNGCTPQNPPEPAEGSGTHTCTSYEGCMDGYPVRWCAHGGDHNPTEKDQGQGESWVPDEAWTFISQF